MFENITETGWLAITQLVVCVLWFAAITIMIVNTVRSRELNKKAYEKIRDQATEFDKQVSQITSVQKILQFQINELISQQHKILNELVIKLEREKNELEKKSP